MARVEPVPSGKVKPDSLHVAHCRAAGLDVHKMQITAAVRLAQPRGDPVTATREFGTLPNGLQDLTCWLLSYGVSAAAMEGTGFLGRRPSRRSSMWLARIRQSGLCRPSLVPPREFRQLRQLSRYRRKLVAERSRTRNRIHKTVDHDGVRLGGALADIFGRNGRRILDGLAAGRSAADILRSLTGHVRSKRELLAAHDRGELHKCCVGTLRRRVV